MSSIAECSSVGLGLPFNFGVWVMKCTTKLCGAKVEKTSEHWKANQYCHYIEAECPECFMTYWIIKRGRNTHLKDRKSGEEFEHRKDRK